VQKKIFGSVRICIGNFPDGSIVTIEFRSKMDANFLAIKIDRFDKKNNKWETAKQGPSGFCPLYLVLAFPGKKEMCTVFNFSNHFNTNLF
jgi:hypothetical protein